jgi:uncharacterized membrane protein YhaH (DUF805 family)
MMFKNPFSFNGRIRRTEFAISFMIYLVSYAFILAASEGNESAKIFLLAFIPLIWFLWAQAAKRCHDVGNSGFYQLVPFYVLWLLFQRGNPYDNQYGEDPKALPRFSPSDFENPFPPEQTETKEPF